MLPPSEFPSDGLPVLPLPPAPIVTVYGYVVDTEYPVVTRNPPPPPPPPSLPAAPPQQPTVRISTVSPKLPEAVTSKVPDEVKICAL